MKKITTPLTDATILDLQAGDQVLITGKMYIARDAAHKKMIEALNNQEALPFDPKGAIIYYAGPAPSRPNQVMNSVGPTSSYRMDPFAKRLMQEGLKATCGKGPRSSDHLDDLAHYKAVYFVNVGGAAALVANKIIHEKIIAYHELGAEALREIEVVDFPVFVGYDCYKKSIIK